jgi:hypothetical protein
MWNKYRARPNKQKTDQEIFFFPEEIEGGDASPTLCCFLVYWVLEGRGYWVIESFPLWSSNIRPERTICRLSSALPFLLWYMLLPLVGWISMFSPSNVRNEEATLKLFQAAQPNDYLVRYSLSPEVICHEHVGMRNSQGICIPTSVSGALRVLKAVRSK